MLFIHFALVRKHLSTSINFTVRIYVGFCHVCVCVKTVHLIGLWFAFANNNFLFAFTLTLNTQTTTTTMRLFYHGNHPFKRIKNALKWIIKLRQRNKVWNSKFNNRQQLMDVWLFIFKPNCSWERPLVFIPKNMYMNFDRIYNRRFDVMHCIYATNSAYVLNNKWVFFFGFLVPIIIFYLRWERNGRSPEC